MNKGCIIVMMIFCIVIVPLLTLGSYDEKAYMQKAQSICQQKGYETAIYFEGNILFSIKPSKMKILCGSIGDKLTYERTGILPYPQYPKTSWIIVNDINY